MQRLSDAQRLSNERAMLKDDEVIEGNEIGKTSLNDGNLHEQSRDGLALTMSDP